MDTARTPFRHQEDTSLLSRGRVEVNAPPHTRAKIGQGYPSERQSDTPTRRRTETSPKSSLQATFLHEPTDEPTATKRHDTKPHTPPQDRRGQTSDKSDDEKTPRDHLTSQKPPRAAADIRTPKDGKRTPPDGRRTPRGRHSDTTRTRPHITNGGGYARTRERNACSYAHRILYYIYLCLYRYRLILCIYYILFIAFLFLLFI